MAKIVIVTEGGIVQDVYSDTPDIVVDVYDLDVYDYDTDDEDREEYLEARAGYLVEPATEGSVLEVDTQQYPYKVR